MPPNESLERGREGYSAHTMRRWSARPAQSLVSTPRMTTVSGPDLRSVLTCPACGAKSEELCPLTLAAISTSARPVEQCFAHRQRSAVCSAPSVASRVRLCNSRRNAVPPSKSPERTRGR
jgi:hypothetical protein